MTKSDFELFRIIYFTLNVICMHFTPFNYFHYTVEKRVWSLPYPHLQYPPGVKHKLQNQISISKTLFLSCHSARTVKKSLSFPTALSYAKICSDKVCFFNSIDMDFSLFLWTFSRNNCYYTWTRRMLR